MALEKLTSSPEYVLEHPMMSERADKIAQLNNNAYIDEGTLRDDIGIFSFSTRIAGKFVLCEGETVTTTRSADEHRPGEGISAYRVLRHCEACIFVYDVGDRDSFEGVKFNHQNLAMERSLERPPYCILHCSPSCPPRQPYQGLKFLIANKNDRPAEERAVTSREGEELAVSLGATFIEAAAKTGSGVGTELLSRMVQQILLNRLKRLEAVIHEGAHAAEGYRLPGVLDVMRDRNKCFWT